MIACLGELLRKVKRKFASTEAENQAFISIRYAITKIALHTYPDSSTLMSLINDPSNSAVGAALQQ